MYALFSPEYGKFSATAKGVKRLNSRRLGSLDTLNLVHLEFSEASSGNKTINQVQAVESYKNLKKAMSGISKGLYMAELVYRFFYYDAYDKDYTQSVFQFLTSSLRSLDKYYSKYPEGRYNFIPVRIMNLFEYRLMKTLGYEMSLENFLLSKLNIGNDEVDYLKSLRLGLDISNANLLRNGYKEADIIIKDYVLGVLDERIYSSKLF